MNDPLPATWESTSVDETIRIAQAIAQHLSAGDCVGISGELGAGKTQLVRGIVQALGGEGRQVSSPTFVLLHMYETPRFPVFHIDAYRIHGSEELESIGFTELLKQQGLMLIEWPERVSGALPAKRFSIALTATGETSRRIEMRKSL